MNYYSRLYDVGFFSHPRQTCAVGGASVEVVAPGSVDWATWTGDLDSARAAEAAYARLRASPLEALAAAPCGLSLDAWLLAVLLACEAAFRDGSGPSLFGLARLLLACGEHALETKAVKLLFAFEALRLLCPGPRPLEHIVGDAVRFVAERRGVAAEVVLAEVRVELPVRRAFLEHRVDIGDPAATERFYRETDAYVLELAAANHQVETLFNYQVIIDALFRMGVTRFLDYGAGIGTFALLGKARGIDCCLADLDSLTSEFAKSRFAGFGVTTEFFRLPGREAAALAGQDCIVCLEVLEHLHEPDRLVRAIHDALPVGGVLVVSQSFDYIEEFITHIPAHGGRGAVFDAELAALGLRRLPLAFDTHPGVYVKTR